MSYSHSPMGYAFKKKRKPVSKKNEWDKGDIVGCSWHVTPLLGFGDTFLREACVLDSWGQSLGPIFTVSLEPLGQESKESQPPSEFWSCRDKCNKISQVHTKRKNWNKAIP